MIVGWAKPVAATRNTRIGRARWVLAITIGVVVAPIA
jgi:hypothetical protein